MTASFFNRQLADLHLLKHPFYQDWMAGRLSRHQLQDYAHQYYTHVAAFPRYLSAIHSNCENAADRQILLENLNDEEGVTQGVSHPDLWLQFAEGMGVRREDVLSREPRAAIKNVTTTFFGAARSSFAQGLGALYAYEAQVPEIAESKIAGLRERYEVDDERTLQFFTVHKTADVQHRAVLEKMIDELPADEQASALSSARHAAQALWDFLTEVHGHKSCVA